MVYLILIGVIALFSNALAQRPDDTSICDYYTPKILNEANSPESQLLLMTVIVNTFILGNYSPYQKVNITVAGIAAPAQYDGATVNLLPYFTGGWASTNRGGSKGTAVNLLDAGGPAPLLENKPANSVDSNQYHLLTHIYQYFGTFYKCSHQGNSSIFPSYQGKASQYEVHKFMNLDSYEMGFFIDQVCLSLTSLGFEQNDIDTTRSSLDLVFNRRCAPAAAVIPESAGPQLQACCIAKNCLLDANSDCAAYSNDGIGILPTVANSTLVGNVTKLECGSGNLTDTMSNQYCSSPPETPSETGGGGSQTASASATVTPSNGAGRMFGVSLSAIAASLLIALCYLGPELCFVVKGIA